MIGYLAFLAAAVTVPAGVGVHSDHFLAMRAQYLGFGSAADGIGFLLYSLFTLFATESFLTYLLLGFF